MCGGRRTSLTPTKADTPSRLLKQRGVSPTTRLAWCLRAATYAVADEAGIAHAIKLLHDEIHTDMAFLGVNPLSELNPDFSIAVMNRFERSLIPMYCPRFIPVPR